MAHESYRRQVSLLEGNELEYNDILASLDPTFEYILFLLAYFSTQYLLYPISYEQM